MANVKAMYGPDSGSSAGLSAGPNSRSDSGLGWHEILTARPEAPSRDALRRAIYFGLGSAGAAAIIAGGVMLWLLSGPVLDGSAAMLPGLIMISCAAIFAGGLLAAGGPLLQQLGLLMLENARLRAEVAEATAAMPGAVQEGSALGMIAASGIALASTGGRLGEQTIVTPYEKLVVDAADPAPDVLTRDPARSQAEMLAERVVSQGLAGRVLGTGGAGLARKMGSGYKTVPRQEPQSKDQTQVKPQIQPQIKPSNKPQPKPASNKSSSPNSEPPPASGQIQGTA